MKPRSSLVATAIGLLSIFLCASPARCEVKILSDNFNSYTPTPLALPTGTLPAPWLSATNTTPFSAQVETDSGNLFAEGSTNQYLQLQSTANSSSEFLVMSNVVSTGTTTGNISFNFYQPTVSGATGDGFILRIGNGVGGNTQTAFGFGIKNGALYAATTSSVNLSSTSFASYGLNTRHTLAVYYNNNATASYLYTVTGSIHTLAARTMDVWLDGTLVGTAIPSCGGTSAGANIAEFNFVSKANFIGTLYVDDVVQRTVSGSAPTVPTGVTATGSGPQMNLAWTSVTGATGYTIAASATSGGPYTVIGTAGTNSATDMPSTSGTYYYVVAATNATDTSLYSSQATGTINVPSQVTGLSASVSRTAGVLDIIWTAVGSPYPATSYKVKRSSTEGGPYTTIASGVTGTTYFDTGLSNNTPYYYVVSGVNANGEGFNSDEAANATLIVPSTLADKFDTDPAGSPPPTGSGQIWNTITNTSPFVGLVTNDTGNIFGNGTSSRYLQMAVTSSSTSNSFYSVNAQPVGGIEGSLAFNFYQPSVSGATGDGFLLRIGNSTGSNVNTAFAVGLKNGGLYQATGTGVNLVSTAFATYTLNAKHSLVVFFNNNTTKTYQYLIPATPAEIYTLPPQSEDVWLDNVRVATALPTCGGLAADNAIVNFNFTSKASFVGALNVDDISFNAVPMVLPATPTGLASSVNGNQVSLSWNPVPGAISYNVQRSTTSGGPYTSVNSWVAGTTSYVDVPSSTGTYYYVVCATNTSTNGANSAQVAATVSSPAGAPGAVTGVSATGLTGQNLINWSPATGSHYATSYNVGRSTTSGGPYSTVATGLTSPSYVDTGLTNGTIYYYVVTGVNSSGTGANSAEFSAVPTTAPTDGTASFSSNWQLDPVLGGWRIGQSETASRLQRDTATATSHGFATARVEVRPGDNPINSSGERSEVAQLKTSTGSQITEDGSSGTVYYAMSYMLPTNWQNSLQAINSGGWSILLQLHGPDTLHCSPAIAIYANSQYSLDVNGGDIDTGPQGVNSYMSAAAAQYSFSDGGPLNLGQWTELVMRVYYSQSTTGSVTIWRRNQGQTAFTQVLNQTGIATLQYRTSMGGVAGPHYWKQGLYRGNYSPTITNVLWDGPIARASSFKAAEWAAFGTAVGSP